MFRGYRHPDDLPEECFLEHMAECPAHVDIQTGPCECDDIQDEIRADYKLARMRGE